MEGSTSIQVEVYDSSSSDVPSDGDDKTDGNGDNNGNSITDFDLFGQYAGIPCLFILLMVMVIIAVIIIVIKGR